MQSNDSSSNSPSHYGINGRRHSSVIQALPKIIRNSNVPSPNYLRASTGSCHDFCKFGRKTASEEARPWRSIRKQSNSSSVVAPSPKVEIFLLKQADTLLNEILPEKVEEDDAYEKGKSCEKIEAEKKMKLFNKKQPTVVAKPKPVVAVISGEMDASIKKDNKMMVRKPKILKAVVRKNTERVEKKVVLDQPVDIERTSNRKPVIKIGKSLDVSTASNISKEEKSSFPAAATISKKEKSPFLVAATISKEEKSSFPAAATISKKEKPSFPAAATISKKEKSSFPAAATSKKEKSLSLSAAVSKPIKSVSTNRLVKTNGVKNSSRQQPTIKKRMVGIHEESNSLEKAVIKQIDESDIIPAVDSSNENGEMIHEESNNENSQQKMEIVVESENPYAESTENGDTMEVDDDETEEDEEEDSIISESSSEDEEEEKEETFSRGNRAKKLAEDSNGNDGVKLKFRRGRVIDIQAEENDSPRRLRFRRGRVENSAEGRSSVKRQNFRKKSTIVSNNNNEDPDSEIIMLRHQEVEEKKDAQGLFNNVIEETASKLVLEARKSKVKALVGAFETVISLQETSTGNTKQSSPQTVLS